MAKGIRDKVAILGMGCAKFGERWDKDADSLMVEAYQEAIADAGIDPSQFDAAWLGVAFDGVNIGPSGIPLSVALRLYNIGVTKVENYCASGTESFRGAVYAVASGAADIAVRVIIRGELLLAEAVASMPSMADDASSHRIDVRRRFLTHVRRPGR